MTTEISIEEIKTIGTAPDGSAIHLTFGSAGKPDTTVILPTGLLPGLLTALFAAAGAAHREQTIRGSADLNISGPSFFTPDGYETATGRDETTGSTSILLRLKKNNVPMIDVVLPPADAATIGNALLEQVAKGPLAPAVRQ